MNEHVHPLFQNALNGFFPPVQISGVKNNGAVTVGIATVDSRQAYEFVSGWLAQTAEVARAALELAERMGDATFVDTKSPTKRELRVRFVRGWWIIDKVEG